MAGAQTAKGGADASPTAPACVYDDVEGCASFAKACKQGCVGPGFRRIRDLKAVQGLGKVAWVKV